jgi:hypothetical protein
LAPHSRTDLTFTLVYIETFARLRGTGLDVWLCMHDLSMPAFQRRVGNQNQGRNLRQLFDITSIPQDPQLREVIDSVDSESLIPIFNDFFTSACDVQLKAMNTERELNIIPESAANNFGSNISKWSKLEGEKHFMALRRIYHKKYPNLIQ